MAKRGGERVGRRGVEETMGGGMGGRVVGMLGGRAVQPLRHGATGLGDKPERRRASHCAGPRADVWAGEWTGRR